MDKIQYNVVERDTNNASGKAKKDVCKIMNQLGYRYLYKPSSIQKIRVMQQFFAISRLHKDVQLFIQYPANLRFFYKYIKQRNSFNTIAIIHDLESLRGTLDVKSEIEILSSFGTLISHNRKMTEYLRNNGIKNKIMDLNIFDYLMDEQFSVIQEYDKNTIAFAGNISKSKFLLSLDQIQNINFLIYGAEFDGLEKIKEMRNVSYRGLYSSEKVIENLAGGWGLVWDGDSLETCNGVTGEYLKYNCPHKVSMYLVAERPVIIWDKAAMADYVKKYNLGITVGNLFDIPEAISLVTQDKYDKMLENIRFEKNRLIKGESLTSTMMKL